MGYLTWALIYLTLFNLLPGENGPDTIDDADAQIVVQRVGALFLLGFQKLAQLVHLVQDDVLHGLLAEAKVAQGFEGKAALKRKKTS